MAMGCDTDEELEARGCSPIQLEAYAGGRADMKAEIVRLLQEELSYMKLLTPGGTTPENAEAYKLIAAHFIRRIETMT